MARTQAALGVPGAGQTQAVRQRRNGQAPAVGRGIPPRVLGCQPEAMSAPQPVRPGGRRPDDVGGLGQEVRAAGQAQSHDPGPVAGQRLEPGRGPRQPDSREAVERAGERMEDERVGGGRHASRTSTRTRGVPAGGSGTSVPVTGTPSTLSSLPSPPPRVTVIS